MSGKLQFLNQQVLRHQVSSPSQVCVHQQPGKKDNFVRVDRLGHARHARALRPGQVVNELKHLFCKTIPVSFQNHFEVGLIEKAYWCQRNEILSSAWRTYGAVYTYVTSIAFI
jgi:hypothetical protein